MSATIQPLVTLGEAGEPAFPDFPQFVPVDIPLNLKLARPTADGGSVWDGVSASEAWHGLIRPFGSDGDARLALRLLAQDVPIAVHGGTLLPGTEAEQIRPHAAEFRMKDTGIIYHVLVTSFEPPAHPWAFSLAPEIAQSLVKHHPHLRTDRVLNLPSRELHAMCLYSTIDFKFESGSHPVVQLLRQVSLYLAKHTIWLKTQRLFNEQGKMIHDGIDMSTLFSSMPVSSIWTKNPPPTHWVGWWPGSEAVSGEGHLQDDPDSECFCGIGLLFKDCHLPQIKAAFNK